MSELNEYNEQQNTNNHQLISTSPNFRTDLAKKLEELVPEAIVDGKVDVVKLKELLASRMSGSGCFGRARSRRCGQPRIRQLQRSSPPKMKVKIGTRPITFSSRAITSRC